LGKSIEEVISGVLARAIARAGYGKIEPLLETPRVASHGDFSTTIAFDIAKDTGANPIDIARCIIDALEDEKGVLDRVEPAGKGFINMRISAEWLRKMLLEILNARAEYGRSSAGKGKKIQVEFVSANPTGPLNVVNARAAAVGDSLARLLEYTGHEVEREYYVNDAGRQIQLLGESVDARLRQMEGKEAEIPDEGYHGEYLIELANEIRRERGSEFSSLSGNKRSAFLAREAVERMLDMQRKDLEDFGVVFQNWFRESELRETNALQLVLDKLRANGKAYESDGAVWLATTEYGDEKDRVLYKSTGEASYFMADIAYHENKFERGFDQVIDLLGPDHHAHVAKLLASARCLGREEGALEIILVQQVNLLDRGEQLKMSKRAGRLVLLRDLVGEVGRDVARFFFLMRKTSSHLDFDMELARNQSDENPVFYVQYAHARICSVLDFAHEQGVDYDGDVPVALDPLDSEEELALLKLLSTFPSFLIRAADAREPHRLTGYLRDLASAFHHFYEKHRVVSDDVETALARLALVDGTRVVLANGLRLLGVSAPEKM
jgi:arginyl-tRNA synthetase